MGEQGPSGLSRRPFLGAGAGAGLAGTPPEASAETAWLPSYLDGRPVATRRLDARDAGPVLRHGDGPDRCDVYGARDIWAYEHGGILYMNYDAAGELGWLAALATSSDGVTWTKHGPVLQLGEPGSDDSASASYGVTYQAGAQDWHLFYVGTPNTTPPDRIPAFPYLTMKAHGPGPAGPWTKAPQILPFRPQSGTYYAASASPGHIVAHRGEYLQFFSASVEDGGGVRRTIGIARTRDLDGAWQLDPAPIVPLDEQVENSSLYYEQANDTWFLFTNHIALDGFGEYTDAIWVYWTHDLDSWDPEDKAVVLDRTNCAWSPYVIGLPSVVPMGDRLAVFYDGRGAADASHMHRDVGLAWLDLPLSPPRGPAGPDLARRARVTASSTYPGYDAARIADGRRSTQLGGDFSWTNAEGAALPQWVELDLRSSGVVGRVDLYTISGYELRDYRLQHWDGAGWVDLAAVTANTSVLRTHTFAPTVCRQLRLLCERGPDRQPAYTRVNAIELYAGA